MGMNVLSLFDGISCGRVALERAGIPVERYVAYEIEPTAIQISKNNYQSIEHCGDVFEANFTEYQGFDLLIGGSPCTHWTIANHRREVTPDGEGGRLFMQFVRALKESGCKYFLYENNASMHSDIKEFITSNLGVKPIMINSALVSAQDRKRLYWTNIPGVTQPSDRNIYLSDIVGCKCYSVVEQPFMRKKINGAYDRRYEPRTDGKASAVVATREKQFNMVMIEADHATLNCTVDNGIFRNDKKEYPICAEDGQYCVRSLTIEEREKLQTLPSGYTAGTIESKARRVIGNAWTVDVITHIFLCLTRYNKGGAENGKLF